MARIDPLKVFRFHVSWPDLDRSVGFRSCTGLEIVTDSIDYREGNKWDMVQKHAGLSNTSNVTLTRGQFYGNSGGATALADWFNRVCPIGTMEGASAPTPGMFGDPDFRYDLLIEQFDKSGAAVAAWTLFNAWPIRFKATSDFDSLTSENSIEELELCAEGISGGAGASFADVVGGAAESFAGTVIDGAIDAIADHFGF